MELGGYPNLVVERLGEDRRRRPEPGHLDRPR